MISCVRSGIFVAGMEKAIFSVWQIMSFGNGCLLFRFTVMMCVYIAVPGGKYVESFVREISRSSALYFSPWCLLPRRELFQYFLRLQQVWQFGRGFCSWAWVSSFLLVVVDLGHGVENDSWPVTVVTVLQRARECIHLVFSTITVTCRFGLSA